VADAFIATRLGDGAGAGVIGAIETRGWDVGAILERALPA
jgi:putative acyl-CoA dehydrogenase